MARSPESPAALLVQAQHALRVSQATLGVIMGNRNRRTIWRYQGGQSLPTPAGMHAVAKQVYAVDHDLAARIAAASSATLESLGLEQPPAPAVAPPVASPTPRIDADLNARLLVEAIVCAAAEALDVSPKAVRPALEIAFARAQETGLSIDVVAKALASKADGSKRAAKGMV